MFFTSAWTDATKTTLALMEASMENARAAQVAMVRQTEIMSRMESPWSVKWSGTAVPFPVLTFSAKGEESSREAFHLMADVNLSAWESTAKAYAAAPAWAKVPFKAPGEFWSKWFDQFQDGKFDAPFPVKPGSIFEKIMPESLVPGHVANESTQQDVAPSETDAPVETSAAPELLKKAKGEADDLTQIKGVGPKLQQTLNSLGVFHLAQIAKWTPENIDWLDDRLSFKGRIQREAWVEQAQSILKSAA